MNGEEEGGEEKQICWEILKDGKNVVDCCSDWESHREKILNLQLIDERGKLPRTKLLF